MSPAIIATVVLLLPAIPSVLPPAVGGASAPHVAGSGPPPLPPPAVPRRSSDLVTTTRTTRTSTHDGEPPPRPPRCGIPSFSAEGCHGGGFGGGCRERGAAATASSSSRQSFLRKASASVGALASVSAAAASPATAVEAPPLLPPPPTSPSSTPPRIRRLGRRSTPSEVLCALRDAGELAPYVVAAGGGTAVVTGGNSGIGYATVSCLVEAGMNVKLCSRRYGAGVAARDGLPEADRGRVSVRRLDLADMASIRGAAEDMLASFAGPPQRGGGGIDVIVNNAGVVDRSGPPTYTAQGLELQWGINHVGHHMLTRLLLPSMNRGGRIVTVSSRAHYFASDTAEWGTGGYSQSKLCNILFAEALQDRLSQEGQNYIKSVSLHPGVVSTPIFDGSTPFWKFVELTSVDRTVEQGAATTALCALSDEVAGGGYYEDCRRTLPSDLARDVGMRLRDDLWERTEEVIAEKGFRLPERLI